MVYPFLYKTSKLKDKKVGFVLVQVKNHASPISPHICWKIFQNMDPFHCNLLDKNDKLDVLIIRIVFSLGDKKPDLIQQTYEPPNGGAITFENGQPKFTLYNFWCSGIGPGLLQPVDEHNSLTKWEMLLGKTDKWDGVFLRSMAPDVRHSQYPAGGTDLGHYNSWFASE